MMKFLCAYLLVTASIANLAIAYGQDEDSTSWIFSDQSSSDDDFEIRERLTAYAEREQSRNYLNLASRSIRKIPNRTMRSLRQKRLVKQLKTVPIQYYNKAFYGIIGHVEDRLIESMTYEDVDGAGCKWTGYAPLCSNAHVCPADYDYVRNHNGRCSRWPLAAVCIPDRSFGYACLNILGIDNYKSLCCKSLSGNCEWSGRWMAAKMGHNIYCKYHKPNEECGEVTCYINNMRHHAYTTGRIVGEHCDMLKMFGYNGKATCGMISWYDSDDKIKDNWYKAG